jgi:beta-lactamase class D
VTQHAFDMTKLITAVAVVPSGWEIHGKTGTGSVPVSDGSYDQAHSYGWFAGWATKGPRTFVFARLIQDEKLETEPAGIRARDAFLKELPSLLDALAQ